MMADIGTKVIPIRAVVLKKINIPEHTRIRLTLYFIVSYIKKKSVTMDQFRSTVICPVAAAHRGGALLCTGFLPVCFLITINLCEVEVNVCTKMS